MTPLTMRPLSVGEILDQAFALYRKHFGSLVLITVTCIGFPLVVFGGLAALTLFGTEAPSGSTYAVLFLLGVLGYLILSQIAAGASVFVVSEGYLGRTIGPWTALGRAAPMIVPLIGLAILTGLVVGMGFLLGLILFFIPGFVLLSGLALGTPCLVLEGPVGPTEAMNRSWALTKGYKWRMFGLLIVSWVLIVVAVLGATLVASIVVSFLVGSPLTDPSATETVSASARVGGVLVQIVQLLVNVIISPFPYCVLTVAYYDLRVRKEGFDLEMLHAAMESASGRFPVARPQSAG